MRNRPADAFGSGVRQRYHWGTPQGILGCPVTGRGRFQTIRPEAMGGTQAPESGHLGRF